VAEAVEIPVEEEEQEPVLLGPSALLESDRQSDHRSQKNLVDLLPSHWQSSCSKI
jgi:hypothetical protein